MSNAAVLAPALVVEDSSPQRLRLVNDVRRGYTKCPTAHNRDLRADGISLAGLAVYGAIASRQGHEGGECFRSNAGIAEELGLHKRTVSRCISQLQKLGYLSIWYVNEARRMRVCTRARRGVRAEVKGGTRQCLPDKETTKKKPLQPIEVDVSSNILSERDDRALWGEGTISRLVAEYGLDAVRAGLSHWDSIDQSKIGSPAGWLRDCIKLGWKLPNKYKKAGAAFPEGLYDHERIVDQYIQEDESRLAIVDKLKNDGLDVGRIAVKIWMGKI